MSKNYVNEGKLIHSTTGKTVKVEIVPGTGKGEGKEYIKLMFSDKPSEKIREELKLHRFHYFKPDSSWSAYKTDKALAFAYGLIKENNPQEEAEETPKTETPKKPTSGKGKTEPKTTKKTKTDEAIEALLHATTTMLTAQQTTNNKLDTAIELLKKLAEK